jgi:hypothetical protein
MTSLHTPVQRAAEDDLVEVRALLAAVLARPAARRRFVRDLAEFVRDARDAEQERDRLRAPTGRLG